jgi:hypothetical protein
VARVNVTRARHAMPGAEPLDLAYLASLDAEAVPLAVSAVLGTASAATQSDDALALERQRCEAAERLLDRWSASGSRLARREKQGRGWRTWNRGDAIAEETVAANGRALNAVRHDACPRVRPAPTRPAPSTAAPSSSVPAGR